MSRKTKSQSTVEPGPVTLDDDDLQTLDNVIKHWNISQPAAEGEPAKWDAKTVLAELARLTLKTMRQDYSADPQPAPESIPPKISTSGLDSPG